MSEYRIFKSVSVLKILHRSGSTISCLLTDSSATEWELFVVLIPLVAFLMQHHMVRRVLIVVLYLIVVNLATLTFKTLCSPVGVFFLSLCLHQGKEHQNTAHLCVRLRTDLHHNSRFCSLFPSRCSSASCSSPTESQRKSWRHLLLLTFFLTHHSSQICGQTSKTSGAQKWSRNCSSSNGLLKQAWVSPHRRTFMTFKMPRRDENCRLTNNLVNCFNRPALQLWRVKLKVVSVYWLAVISRQLFVCRAPEQCGWVSLTKLVTQTAYRP